MWGGLPPPVLELAATHKELRASVVAILNRMFHAEIPQPLGLAHAVHRSLRRRLRPEQQPPPQQPRTMTTPPTPRNAEEFAAYVAETAGKADIQDAPYANCTRFLTSYCCTCQMLWQGTGIPKHAMLHHVDGTAAAWLGRKTLNQLLAHCCWRRWQRPRLRHHHQRRRQRRVMLRRRQSRHQLERSNTL